jgi:hypothetical protein
MFRITIKTPSHKLIKQGMQYRDEKFTQELVGPSVFVSGMKGPRFRTELI